MKVLPINSPFIQAIRSIPVKTALAALVVALASCMQAEKISLDTSGTQGMLIGSFALESGLFVGATTIPYSKVGSPTVVATIPADGATIAPCSGSPCRSRVTIRFDETMDATTAPSLTVADFAGGAYTPTSITVLATGVQWSSTVYSNDTVTFLFNSLQLPEGANLQLTLDDENPVHDLENNMPVVYSWTETTTYKSGRLPLVDTGSTLCTDASSTIWDPNACSSTGQDAEILQPRSLVNNGNGTVTDTVTGLVWSACTEGANLALGSCSGSATAVTWNMAVAACSARNTENLGGRSDWRLPMYDELLTIVDLDQYSPTANPSLFPGTMADIYWSASVPSEYTASAYYVHFVNGAFIRIASKSENHFVRCVAGDGQRSSAGFVDNGNNTVSDSRNGLLWTRCPIGPSGTACEASNATQDWNNALKACRDLTLAGKSWRLPSRNEMLSIWMPQTANHLPPAIALNGASNVWTSTTSRQAFLTGSSGLYPNAFVAVFDPAPSISPVSGKGAMMGFYCVTDE